MGLCTLAIAALLGAPPPESELAKRSELLVEKLGSKNYREREKAALELLTIGYAAKPAVLTGQKSLDLEISDRCTKLYPVIWRMDLDKRIQKFMADPNAAITDDLPAAAEWLKFVGDSKESRMLYGDVVSAHSELLQQLQFNPERRSQLYTDLARDVYSRTYGRTGVPASGRGTPTEIECALFLFLGSGGSLRTTLPPGTSSTYYYQFVNSPILITKLQDSVVYRKLLCSWLERERYSLMLRRGIDIASQCSVKECLPTLVQIAKDPTTVMYVRATAILGFTKLGTKDSLKDIQPFLDDKSVVTNVVVNGERGTVQIRDVALGAAVLMSGQAISDFGFDRKMPVGLANPSYIYFAFGTDEKRDAAHAKWKAFSTKGAGK